MVKTKTDPKRPALGIRDMIGWYGVLAILAAYGLLSFKVIGSNSLAYQLLNLTGAVALIIETAAKRDVQPVALNIVWAAVALVAIVRIVVS
jgi:hypothetical protein